MCDFYFKVMNKLVQSLKVPFKLNGDTRIEDTPVHEAVREALVNCLVNADYYGRCGVVIKRKLGELTLSIEYISDKTETSDKQAINKR